MRRHTDAFTGSQAKKQRHTKTVYCRWYQVLSWRGLAAEASTFASDFRRTMTPRRVPDFAGVLEPGDVPAEHFGLHPVRANKEAVPP